MSGRPRTKGHVLPPRPNANVLNEGQVGAPVPVGTPPPARSASPDFHVGGPPPAKSPIMEALEGPALEEMLAEDEPPVRARGRANAYRPPARATGEFVVPNPDLYHKDRAFQDYLAPKNQQGWKIHVPAPSSYELSAAYRGLFAELQTRKIPHKFVRSRDFMQQQMDSGPYAVTQAGKFLTIYPDDEKQLLETVAYIDATLDPLNFLSSPRTPGDKPVGERNKISVRYGALTGRLVVKAEKADEEGANRSVENYARDSREVYKPEGIRDPFDPESEGADGWIESDVGLRETERRGMISLQIISDDKVVDSGIVA